jgi:hypothetical protein
MNTPTPLGKQTFAEYEKEVKEYKAFKLSSQRFDFNTQKDLYNLVDEFWGLFDKSVEPFDKIEGTLKAMIKDSEKAKLSAKEYIKKAEDFNKQIKELGLSEKDAKAGTYIKQRKEDLKSLDNWVRVIKKFIADAKNVD